MSRHDVRKPLLVLVILASFSWTQFLQPGFALATPVLRVRILPLVQARCGRVSLLDLCDPKTVPSRWKRFLAGIDIGAAPRAGMKRYVDSERLRRYLTRLFESHGLKKGQFVIEIPDSIVVERRFVTIPMIQIEKQYRDFIEAHSPWDPKDLVIGRVMVSGVKVLPAGQVRCEITSPANNKMYLGNVPLLFHYFVDDELVRTLRVTARVELIQKVVCPKRLIPENTSIEPDDLILRRINIGTNPGKFATRSEQVVGFQAREDLQPNRPIPLKVLRRPVVVRRGSRVTIVYERPGFRLTAKGLVKEDGVIGDLVKVMNESSKRTIYCRVVSDKQVTVVP